MVIFPKSTMSSSATTTMADKAQRGRKPINEPAAKATTATMRAENTLAIWEREPEAMPAAVRDMEAEHGGQPMRPTNALARPKVRTSPSGDGAGASPAETPRRTAGIPATPPPRWRRRPGAAPRCRDPRAAPSRYGKRARHLREKDDGKPAAAASPLHSRAAATSTTMAEGTFGKKRFRRYMPAMHRADTTAQAHEAPGRHETMAATFGHNGTGGVGRRAQKQRDLADDHRDRDAEYEPVHDRQRHAADEIAPPPASSRRNSAVKREQGHGGGDGVLADDAGGSEHRGGHGGGGRIHAEDHAARAGEIARRRRGATMEAHRP